MGTIHVGLGGHSMEDLTLTSTFNLPQHYVLLCHYVLCTSMYKQDPTRPNIQNVPDRSRSKKKLQRPCGARCSATHALPEFQPACDSPGTSRSPDSPVALVLQVDRRSEACCLPLWHIIYIPSLQHSGDLKQVAW